MAIRILSFSLALLMLTSTNLAEPLTFKDLQRMRAQKQTADQIVEAAKEKGLAFDVDDAMKRRLLRMRFSADQVNTLQEIYDNPEAFKAVPGVGDAAADKRDINPEAKTGPRMPDAAQDRYQKMAEDILSLSGVGYKPTQTHRTTLWASDATTKSHAPDIIKIQQLNADNFGGLFKKGLDPRSAHMVICDTQYDYEKVVDALFDVMEKNRMRFEGDGIKDMAMRAAAFSTSWISIMNREKTYDADRSKRMAVYGIGKMYMYQLTEGKCGVGLQSGFGNYCEATIFKLPGCTSAGYGSGQNQNKPQRWDTVMTKLKRANEIDQPVKILDSYTLPEMEIPQFAQAWSLTTLLAQAPKKFEEVTVKIRDTGSKSGSVFEVYNADSNKLYQVWLSTLK